MVITIDGNDNDDDKLLFLVTLKYTSAASRGPRPVVALRDVHRLQDPADLGRGRGLARAACHDHDTTIRIVIITIIIVIITSSSSSSSSTSSSSSAAAATTTTTTTTNNTTTIGPRRARPPAGRCP